MGENILQFAEFSKEAPFSDPVVRCLNCRKLVVVAAQIAEKGMCACGSRRFLEIRNLNKKEWDAVNHYWPKFAAHFKALAPDTQIIGVPDVNS